MMSPQFTDHSPQSTAKPSVLGLDRLTGSVETRDTELSES